MFARGRVRGKVGVMRVIVTCGPSYEPIDEVRRITNFSTGELGLRLAKRLARDGHEVTCFRGEAATRPVEPGAPRFVAFSTNTDLLDKLSAIEGRERIGAIFHAAALADFTVLREDSARKMSSREGRVTLTLIPTLKLIGQLRGLFSQAWITGWKYELDGTKEELVATAERQIAENSTNACVINGAAYGAGFGIVTRSGGGAVVHASDKVTLSDLLAKRLMERVGLGG